MNIEHFTSYFTDAIYLAILIVVVLTTPGLVIGLLISIFQAATQIQEQTLSFLPKLIVNLLMIIFAGHWILIQIQDLFSRLFMNIPTLIS